jgi:hypothetical protein
VKCSSYCTPAVKTGIGAADVNNHFDAASIARAFCGAYTHGHGQAINNNDIPPTTPEDSEKDTMPWIRDGQMNGLNALDPAWS